MKVTHNLRIDLCRCGVPSQIAAVQGEGNTRVVVVTLFDKGIAWEIPAETTAALAFEKPDGTRGLYDTLPNGDPATTLQGNMVQVTLAPQVLTAAGRVKASVVLYDKDMDTLATFPFWIAVEANPAAGEQISNDYYKYSTLEELNQAIEALSGGNSPDAVLIVPQTLNDAQKAQARKNIGAASVEEVLAALPVYAGEVEAV